MSGTPPIRFRAAFSLVELLVVMGIIGVLAVLAAPAFQTLTGAKGMTNAVNVIQATLDYARTEAQARQTYVWVGFKNSVNSSSNSETLLTVGYSIDGTLNTNATNITSPSRVERFENVRLLSASTNTNNATNIMSRTTWPTLSRTNSLTNIVFSNVLTFTPNGQVLFVPDGPDAPTSSTPYVPLAEIYLVSSRGTDISTDNSDKATINVVGATGAVKAGAISR